ncbi:hypothetical protein VOLCADRAFT_107334 [Volvox carteri f. nagariensis]|uniref:Uncharacterized protein n=1 Tax=Volvox carteri f. nagariensis TaxID=3068 RepID=D8UDC9_VOLCA|nr:uncharacterized protein VOLCADRAFT_107334 [Volvox carteri f. nagariensis]EFJ42288.1 hypothetical protein VOLCADRAFT_107334 [Volvox carteri f. nagariensis]|eukprot:XP_002956686.1 hypothetical protein VOLCADRAFT_107334 [Volvox carteri f. nagariensis]
MDHEGSYARGLCGAVPNLPPLHKLPQVKKQDCTQDMWDQDKAGRIDYPLWGDLSRGSSNMMMLPGAWAVGDGLLLEAEMHEVQWSVSSNASYGSAPWNVESLSSQVVRLAGSFRRSLGGYIADLTTALTSDTAISGDTELPEHTTFIEGEIAWMPHASASCTSADKKQK